MAIVLPVNIDVHPGLFAGIRGLISNLIIKLTTIFGGGISISGLFFLLMFQRILSTITRLLYGVMKWSLGARAGEILVSMDKFFSRTYDIVLKDVSNLGLWKTTSNFFAKLLSPKGSRIAPPAGVTVPSNPIASKKS